MNQLLPQSPPHMLTNVIEANYDDRDDFQSCGNVYPGRSNHLLIQYVNVEVVCKSPPMVMYPLLDFFSNLFD
jgi:hypothetical protein